MSELVTEIREGEKRRSNGDVRRRATARGAMEKSRYLRVIKKEEVKRDDPIKYLLPTTVRSTF